MLISLKGIGLDQLRAAKAVIFDFDGVFTDNFVYTSQTGIEMVRCSRLDGIGLNKLRIANIPHVVISSETNVVVEERCRKLGIKCLSGVDDKVESAKHWLASHGVSLGETVFLANDENDIPLLSVVGYPAVVQDCTILTKSCADFMVGVHGGKGAVRALCDFLTT